MGELLTEPRSKADKDAGLLGETAKTRLDKVAIEIRTGRREELDVPAIRHGLLQEGEAIDIYGKFRGQKFKKNVLRLTNRWLTGEFDLDEKDRTGKRKRIIDIKNRTNVQTFFSHYTSGVAKKEAAQLQSYTLLAGCQESEIANVLANKHPDEINKLLYYEALKFRDPKDPDAMVLDLPLWRKIEVLTQHIFDMKTMLEYINGEYMDDEAKEALEKFIEIPLSERVIREDVEADPLEHAKIISACEKGWEYLAEVWNIHNIPEDGVDV